MMIMEQITSLDDADFDKCWEDCKVQMQGENRSIPSKEAYGVETEEELKQFIKDYSLRSDKIIWRLKDGDTLYLLWVGDIREGYFYGEFILPCNVNGSKSWVNSEEYKNVRRAFFDSKGVYGLRCPMIKDSVIHRSLARRIAEGSWEGTIEDHPDLHWLVVVTAR